MPQSALDGRQAVTKGSVEMERRRGKLEVRYRTMAGYETRKTFDDSDEAHRYFWECAEKLEKEAKAALV